MAGVGAGVVGVMGGTMSGVASKAASRLSPSMGDVDCVAVGTYQPDN